MTQHKLEQMRRRIESKFGTNVIECSICGEKFGTGRSIGKHLSAIHGVSPLAGKPSPRLPIRVCQDCKGDMTGRGGSSFRCVECQKAANQAVMAQHNLKTHRRRQEKFGTNLDDCPVCERKFAPGTGMRVHQRSHADSSTPPKVATRSCQDCGGDISNRSPESSRCLPCQTDAEPAEPEPIEPEPVEPASTSAESESEYTPTPLDDLVDKLLEERSLGKGQIISGMSLVAVYIDAMIIAAEVTHQEAQDDLAALCRIKELLADN